MSKLANKIALVALFGAKKGMEKKSSPLPPITSTLATGALAGGLAGASQINDGESLLPKPTLGAVTGTVSAVPGGLAGLVLGNVATDRLMAIADKIKNEKAKAILTSLAFAAPSAGLVVGGAGAGALAGLGTSKLLDL